MGTSFTAGEIITLQGEVFDRLIALLKEKQYDDCLFFGIAVPSTPTIFAYKSDKLLAFIIEYIALFFEMFNAAANPSTSVLFK